MLSSLAGTVLSFQEEITLIRDMKCVSTMCSNTFKYYVDNVDYMGGLKHVGVVSKCPGDDDDVDNDDEEEEDDNLSTALFM